MPIAKIVGNLLRTQEILSVFLRHGFGDLVRRAGLGGYLTSDNDKLTDRTEPTPEKAPSARRFRLALEDLGGAFVKLGQVLSTRPDILPPAWTDELRRLQDDVGAVDFELIKHTLEEELGPTETRFTSVSPTPLAVGSIAQVHRGIMFDGTDVVLKVRKPGVKKAILRDCDVLEGIAELLEKHIPESRNYRPLELVNQFRRAVQGELDFSEEARNLDRFALDFRSSPDILFPQVYWDQTTERVLTMQRMIGTKISLLDQLKGDGAQPKELAETLAESLLRQILEHGFFHGDPHPGNLLVIDGSKICFLDCGMVGRLDERTKHNFVLLVEAGIRKDPETVADLLLGMDALPEDLDRSVFVREVDIFLERYTRIPLKRLRLKSIIDEAMDIIHKFSIQVPPDVLLVSKALITLESITRDLDPDFDVVPFIEPFVREMIVSEYGPRMIAKNLYQSARDVMRLLRDLPSDLRELARTLRDNQMRIVLEHHGLKEAFQELDRASKRISISIIIASIVLASSIVVHARAGPLMHGIPVLALGGISVAVIMGLWLLFTAFGKKKQR